MVASTERRRDSVKPTIDTLAEGGVIACPQSEQVTNRLDQTVAERRIGKHFREAHKNILLAFDRLVCSAEFSQLNFEPRDFIYARGKPQRTIQMTKDCSTASATACGRNAYSALNIIGSTLSR